MDRVAAFLSQNGIRHFYSKRHIRGARQWHGELGAALARCDAFVLILTPSAVRSEWVKRELLYALQTRRYKDRILPLIFEKCRAEKLSWTLAGFEHIDFRGRFEQASAELVDALR